MRGWWRPGVCEAHIPAADGVGSFMDWERGVRVLEICLPVFGLIALGKIFQLKGVMNAGHREFINRLVYYFCLPFLIFIKVAAQDPRTFLNFSLLAGVTLPTVGISLLFILVARLWGLRGSLAAAFVFGAFYANTAYMGFPLAEDTFGPAGMASAALFNAAAIPVYMIAAFAVIGWYGAGARVESFGARLKRVVINPFILACVAGVGVSVALAALKNDAGVLQLPYWVVGAGRVVQAFLAMVAQMGLPLSLLAIGGVLHLNAITRNFGPLGLDIAGKLVLCPLLTLLTFRYLFPAADGTLVGVSVLLQATPNAVVSYVIACQIGVDEKFVSAQLVLSTVLAAVTIPVWIYFLM